MPFFSPTRPHRFFLSAVAAGLLVGGCTTTSPSPLLAQASAPERATGATLLFSEYLEGSSFDKAVEIWNASAESVDLAAGEVEVVIYRNGDTAIDRRIALSGTLAAGATHVVVNARASAALRSRAQTETNSLDFNGDDAVALLAGGMIVDGLGEIGFDPGSEWGTGDVTTRDHGLVRRPEVCTGTTDLTHDFDPSVEWIGGPPDDFTGFSSHTADCAPGTPRLTEIWQIQGPGDASPLVGERIITTGNVVTAVASDGFAMQTPAAFSDNDSRTSDGIWVYTGGAPGVEIGDEVEVSGTVLEYFDFTELSDNPEVTVTGSAALPPAVTLSEDLPSSDPATSSCSGASGLECLEGMRVILEEAVVASASQSFSSDPIAEAVISVGERLFREPGLPWPGNDDFPEVPVWDGNPEGFELDPDRLGLPNRLLFGGTRLSAQGVIGFEFGDWELWPSALDVEERLLPKPVSRYGRLTITVGSANLERLFDDIDDPEDDPVPSPEDYLARLQKIARYVISSLRSPHILAVQEVENLGVLQDLAQEIRLLDGPSYVPLLIEGNDRGGIDVGYLVRAPVTVNELTQLGANEVLDFDDSLLHDRPPLLLETSVPDGEDIAVLNLHLRSLGGIDSAQNGERVRQKRLAQAESVARMVQSWQSEHPDGSLLVIGDWNAYPWSDGYVDVVGHIKGSFDPSAAMLSGADLVSPDLVPVRTSRDPSELYSFVFRGNAQVLDQALVTSAGRQRILGASYARGNADAPAELRDDWQSPLRVSDHDGLVVRLRRNHPLFSDDFEAGLATWAAAWFGH